MPAIINLHFNRSTHTNVVDITGLTIDETLQHVCQQATQDLSVPPSIPRIILTQSEFRHLQVVLRLRNSKGNGQDSLTRESVESAEGVIHVLIPTTPLLVSSQAPMLDDRNLEYSNYGEVLSALINNKLDDLLAKYEQEDQRVIDELARDIRQLENEIKGEQKDQMKVEDAVRAHLKELEEMFPGFADDVL